MLSADKGKRLVVRDRGQQLAGMPGVATERNEVLALAGHGGESVHLPNKLIRVVNLSYSLRCHAGRWQRLDGAHACDGTSPNRQ